MFYEALAEALVDIPLFPFMCIMVRSVSRRRQT
jgi:hypothetical protein